MTLRDALLKSLETLPGNRTFHLHTIISVPRIHAGLFPHAHPRPRGHLQDILVLLSEQEPGTDEHVFVTAIEVALYTISSTNSALLYVAKVDSTGQAQAPSPTATLVRAFLAFYTNPMTRPIQASHLWIHVFARSQTQYLFPNSADFEGKRVLSDIRLCAWWKKLLEETASVASAHTGSGGGKIHLSYLLPGMSELEAMQALRTSSASVSTSSQSWEYGQPFSAPDIPPPCPPPSKGEAHLGHFIPYFEDDPKSRFLDDIAFTTDGPMPHSPAKKRRKLDPDDEEPDVTKASSQTEASKSRGHHPQGELSKVSVSEYWERMGFRQECVQGAITGFFALAVSSPATVPSSAAPPGPRPGEVSLNVYHRIHTALTEHNEFSSTERAFISTEVVEGVIRSMCETGAAEEESFASSRAPPAPNPQPPSSEDARPTIHPTQPVLDPPAEILPRTYSIPPPSDVHPNPPVDPAPSSPDMYGDYIYGCIHVNNDPLPPKPTKEAPVIQQVTVLTARKKKKQAA
jgi:regulator of Ty1 transposition protein 109